MRRNIKIAKSAGFCFGVRRAVSIAEELGRSGKKTVTLGPIIHNAHVVGYLRDLGIKSVENAEQIPEGYTAIIRSHGVPQSVLDELNARGIEYVDATCPYVSRIHGIVAEKSAEGYVIIIIGAKEHPEVLGIAGRCENAIIAENKEQLAALLESLDELEDRRICVVAQTTIDRGIWKDCAEIIKKLYTNCEIFDTICTATYKRQLEAREIAAQSDIMLVIGDRSSSNTRALYKIAGSVCPEALQIESAADIDLEALGSFKRIGITAGASTPDWIIKEVKNKMSEETKNYEGETFEEMIDKTLITLNTGEKVTGVVTAVTPSEIQVDLGTKYAGYIPIAEVSNDPSENPEEVFKVGDEVEAFVIRVNDVEGVITLSKRRLDAVKGWEDIEQAKTSREILEGIVLDENKGGVIVAVKNARVFVPASQTGLPREAPMSQLIKQKVKLRITEVNRGRKRVVGSIRSVMNEERRAASEKVWNEIEAGKVYSGAVKSMTSYGAFVDIGGVDGMVHISEMSWKRISHPSEVFNVGDVVEVFVKDFDKEKKRISLGYKKESENPWKVFTGKYSVGDTATVKIVKMMPFGAFAEIVPGVDGLIHISQISTRRISKPAEVLSEGQEVEAKITNIDYENKKISLSIRALITGEEAAEPEIVKEMGEDEIVATSGESENAIEEEAPASVEAAAPETDAPSAVEDAPAPVEVAEIEPAAEAAEAEAPAEAPEEAPAPVEIPAEEAPAPAVEDSVPVEEAPAEEPSEAKPVKKRASRKKKTEEDAAAAESAEAAEASAEESNAETAGDSAE